MHKKLLAAGAGAVALLVLAFVLFGTSDSPGLHLAQSGEQSAQALTLEVFGHPAHFVVEYLPLKRETGSAYVRHEVWYYPDLNKKFAFLAGDIAYTDRLDPASVPTHNPTLRPEDFVFGQSPADVAQLLSSPLEQVELIPGLEEDGVTIQLNKEGLFVFEDNELTFVQTLGTSEDGAPVAYAPDAAGALELYIGPDVAYARNIFRDGLRCLGKVCRFVLEAPDKVTRPLGPVVGPIASTILTQNIAKHAKLGKIFRDAKRIDSIVKSVEEQQRLVGELKKVYADQATTLRTQAEELSAQKDLLGKQLVGGVISFDEYMEQAMDIHLMLQSLEAGAQKMERAAERVNTGTILGLLGKNVLKELANQAGDIVATELRNEVKRLVNFDVVRTLLRQGEGGEDAILDLLFSTELRSSLAGGDGGVDLDELKRRIREQLKQMMKEKQRDLRNNWNERISEIIRTTRDQLSAEMSQDEKDELDLAGTVCEQTVEKAEGEQCGAGYDFRPRTGVGCVQTNCNDVPNAHYSYVHYCVCGSSGSINENPNDPNKECHLPPNCGPCPSCVYACVHFDEACPALPSQ